MKHCTKCSLTKPLSEFHKDKTTSDGLYSSCSDCKSEYSRTNWLKESARNSAKDSRLMRMYGLSLSEYNSMFNDQQGKCDICKIHQSTLKKSLAVDHYHVTGKVRGLLCTKCNKFLGHFEKYMSSGIIEVFKQYLNKSVKEVA